MLSTFTARLKQYYGIRTCLKTWIIQAILHVCKSGILDIYVNLKQIQVLALDIFWRRWATSWRARKWVYETLAARSASISVCIVSSANWDTRIIRCSSLVTSESYMKANLMSCASERLADIRTELNLRELGLWQQNASNPGGQDGVTWGKSAPLSP